MLADVLLLTQQVSCSGSLAWNLEKARGAWERGSCAHLTLSFSSSTARAADKSRAVGPDLPLAVAQAAEQRLQQAATHSRESKRDLASAASPPGRLHPLVPPLFQLCLQGAVTLLTGRNCFLLFP